MYIKKIKRLYSKIIISRLNYFSDLKYAKKIVICGYGNFDYEKCFIFHKRGIVDEHEFNWKADNFSEYPVIKKKINDYNIKNFKIKINNDTFASLFSNEIDLNKKTILIKHFSDMGIKIE
jgi:hypothetical protein